jgi:hypothetical protein
LNSLCAVTEREEGGEVTKFLKETVNIYSFPLASFLSGGVGKVQGEKEQKRQRKKNLAEENRRFGCDLDEVAGTGWVVGLFRLQAVTYGRPSGW